MIFWEKRENIHVCILNVFKSEEAESADWSKLLDQDQWLEAISLLSISASLSVLLESSGQISNNPVRIISAMGLQSSSHDFLINLYTGYTPFESLPIKSTSSRVSVSA